MRFHKEKSSTQCVELLFVGDTGLSRQARELNPIGFRFEPVSIPIINRDALNHQ